MSVSKVSQSACALLHLLSGLEISKTWRDALVLRAPPVKACEYEFRSQYLCEKADRVLFTPVMLVLKDWNQEDLWVSGCLPSRKMKAPESVRDTASEEHS